MGEVIDTHLQSVIDIHAHMVVANLPHSVSAEQMKHFKERESPFFVDPSQVNDFEEKYLDNLAKLVRESGYIGKVVLLAMDRPYDGNETHFYVDNEAVAELVKKYDEFLFGASVNPARQDRIEALDCIKDLGAVLNKLLPNSQRIDLSNPEYDKFWEKMAELGMPLLVHTGREHTFLGTNNDYGNPRLSERAAEIGVKVLLSHCGSPDHFDEALEMIANNANVYGEVAAMGRKIRYGCLLRLAQRKDVHEKLIFGTDYPLPPQPDLFGVSIPEKTKLIANPFDRYCNLLLDLGFSEEVFYKGAQLLNPS